MGFQTRVKVDFLIGEDDLSALSVVRRSTQAQSVAEREGEVVRGQNLTKMRAGEDFFVMSETPGSYDDPGDRLAASGM